MLKMSKSGCRIQKVDALVASDQSLMRGSLSGASFFLHRPKVVVDKKKICMYYSERHMLTNISGAVRKI